MTGKRFTCHQMIADYSTGEDIDFDFLQELIDEQKQPKDLRMHISDGNKIITYRECVDLLNTLLEENEQLKNELRIYRKLASCSNCDYHNYDWYDDGDEFEVCDKGNDITDGICEDWREL